MPDIEWNRRWGKNVKKFDNKRSGYHYGDQWGDPNATGLRGLIQQVLRRRWVPGNLSVVVEKYIKPYVAQDKVILEIGAGGGRWTQYLLAAKEIIIVELNEEFEAYLRERFRAHCHKFRFYHTSGYEMDGIETNSVDFIFTFGTFVHIDPEGIQTYLGHIHRVLKPAGIAVIQYADQTKGQTKFSEGFSDMDPNKMFSFVKERDFLILAHDTSLLSHSNIITIQKKMPSEKD